jgi:hypothetical protein
MQTNRNIISATLIVVIAALSSLWLLYSNSSPNQVIVSQLDLTCGFTDDFSAFLKSASKDSCI